MDYTAVGQTTHVAARMEQMALPGSSLLSAQTLALAEGYIEVRSLGPLPIKGLEAPLDVYELTGAGPARTRLQAARTGRGLTRFVGRPAELEQLRRALELAAKSHGQVAAVVGEAGVGKSRLMLEFRNDIEQRFIRILQSRCHSHRSKTPYLPFIDLLREAIGLRKDAPEQLRTAAISGIEAVDPNLAHYVPIYLHLLSVQEG